MSTTMNTPSFQHKDGDGDILNVWAGAHGAVFYAAGHDFNADAVMVAVRFDNLPSLISTLQAILDSEDAA